MSKLKVLVVEDEEDILEVIRYNLEQEGYEVISCMDGLQGLEQARKLKPDLVLLDIMLPGMDGVEVCRNLKEADATRLIPIIMVTAKGREIDIVLGLGVGADDYIPKPFKVRELVARVKAMLRRTNLQQETAPGQPISAGDLVIDLARHEVICCGEKVDFTATEFRLLHYLASHPGRVYSRAELLDPVVGDDVVVSNRNIDVHVRALRKKLCSCSGLIETIRGVGYRFKETR